ncbi:MAG: acyclic terpene utilization AtuA family protein [Rhodospirillaceae bacterium]
MKTIRIGTGAGYSGDRIEPAVELAEKGEIGYLVFECLAERTIAIAQQARLANPDMGYDALMVDRLRAVLPACRKNGVRIITNMGAANPLAAGRKAVDVAKELGFTGIKVATVSGDEVRDLVISESLRLDESGKPAAEMAEAIVSANAYLGARPIADALGQGADIVITGRVADPSLFLAPMLHEFGWSDTDWEKLGKGTVVGHLMECAGQVTGGYYADPGVKDVPGLGHLGFPIAEVDETGRAVITKVAEAGGIVTTDTCKEQIIYELHDPHAYKTPDVTADFSGVRFVQEGPDRVRVEGGNGRERPETLKVSVGYKDGFHGEGQISYAGPGAVARGRLALDIVAERLETVGLKADEIRYDLIGVNSLHGEGLSQGAEPYEVRVRVIARTRDKRNATLVGNEVETLYTNGPACGGGAAKSVKEIVAMDSTLVPRAAVNPHVDMLEA